MGCCHCMRSEREFLVNVEIEKNSEKTQDIVNISQLYSNKSSIKSSEVVGIMKIQLEEKSDVKVLQKMLRECDGIQESFSGLKVIELTLPVVTSENTLKSWRNDFDVSMRLES